MNSENMEYKQKNHIFIDPYEEYKKLEKNKHIIEALIEELNTQNIVSFEDFLNRYQCLCLKGQNNNE